MSGLLYVYINYINTAPLSPLTNNTPYIHFLICLQSLKCNFNMPAANLGGHVFRKSIQLIVTKDLLN